MSDEGFMGLALDEARVAQEKGDVPVGAIIVVGGEVVARGHNLREVNQDPCAHAELLAIRQAAAVLGSWRVTNATLYVTLEPCLMCMGALLLARIDRLVFGAWDPKGGAAGTLYDLSNDPRLNHRIEVVAGVREPECAEALRDFFRSARARKKAQRGASDSVLRISLSQADLE